MLPCVGREHYRLSVTDGCRCWGDDESSMRFRVPKWLVNIAHYSKLYAAKISLGDVGLHTIAASRCC